MASQTLNSNSTWSRVHKICAGWIVIMTAIAAIAIMDVSNIMVHDSEISKLIRYTWMSTLLTVACGVALAWREHQTHALPHFGKMILGYVFVVFSCGTIGAAAMYGGLPRVSVMFSHSNMSVNAEFYKISEDRMSRRTQRSVLRKWGWQLRHPNHEVYDMLLDHYRAPLLRKQVVSVGQRHGVRTWPRGGGGPAVPTPVLLHGVGNDFAMRVLDFTLLDSGDDI